MEDGRSRFVTLLLGVLVKELDVFAFIPTSYQE
jgi:hypothetical protein